MGHGIAVSRENDPARSSQAARRRSACAPGRGGWLLPVAMIASLLVLGSAPAAAEFDPELGCDARTLSVPLLNDYLVAVPPGQAATFVFTRDRDDAVHLFAFQGSTLRIAHRQTLPELGEHDITVKGAFRLYPRVVYVPKYEICASCGYGNLISAPNFQPEVRPMLDVCTGWMTLEP